MYGLRQAAVLAYNYLSSLLKQAGYTPIVGSLGLWKHQTRKTLFSLCVDDFGIKYYTKDDVDHLLSAIEKQYTAKVDWTGRHFLGFTLDWQYSKDYVDISMPDYLPHLLKRLCHTPVTYPQYSPHEYIQTRWTKSGTRQYACQTDTSPYLSQKDKIHSECCW